MENKIKETENGIVVTPDQASIEVVASYVEETLEKSEVAMRDGYKINIALDELYSNIVRYSGASEAKVSCVVDEHTCLLYTSKQTFLFSLNNGGISVLHKRKSSIMSTTNHKTPHCCRV